jgi:hypothetical protein
MVADRRPMLDSCIFWHCWAIHDGLGVGLILANKFVDLSLSLIKTLTSGYWQEVF